MPMKQPPETTCWAKIGDLRKLIEGKPDDMEVPLLVEYGEVEDENVWVRIDSLTAKRRPFGLHLVCSLVGEETIHDERNAQAAEDFKIGVRVFWTDPDRFNPCDGWGKITSMKDEVANMDTIITVTKKDGGEVECTPDELSLKRAR